MTTNRNTETKSNSRPLMEPSSSACSEAETNPRHRKANKIIEKFMEKKMGGAPPETHADLRKQSVFNFYEQPRKKEHKHGCFKRFVKKAKKYRTLIASLILALYVAIGAAVFMWVESTSHENVEQYGKDIREKAANLYESLDLAMNPKCGPIIHNMPIESNECLLKLYNEMYAIHAPKQNINGYMDALVYVLTMITTIGYGHLICYTMTGKLVTIFYGIIGIALVLYVLRNNGKLALRCCNWMLKLSTFCFQLCTTRPCKMTVFKAAILLIVFWTIGGLGIAAFENFVFFDAIYFSFVTFSTIGFGDFVPNSNASVAIIFTLHFIDLSLLSMVFALVHESMESNFMEVLELLDEGYRRHTTMMNTATMNLNLPSPAQSNVNLKTAREKSKER
ncbi:unnamed protein product [Caenorhabditis sp. 36 PRJEB53466]|nr:unnamed protein product [Caenorhabditis sp. 36 PRJEB53466]